MNKKDMILVYMGLLFAAFIWGINPTIMKIGLIYMSNISYNFIRMLVALLVSIIILIISKRYKRMEMRDIGKIFLITLFGFFLFQIFLIWGVSKTTAGNTSIIMATLPVYVIIINYIFKIEKINKKIVLGIFLSILGVVLIVLASGANLSISKNDALGIVIISISQLAYAIYTVFSKTLVKKYSNYQVIFMVILFTTIFYSFASLKEISNIDWSGLPLIAWLSIVGSGIFAMFVGNVIWVWAVNRIGSSKTSLFTNLQPVISIISGYFILGETFRIGQIFGGIIVLYGVYITRDNKKSEA
ncbi:DMT family transporter [Clostridium sp. DL1XJH146]